LKKKLNWTLFFVHYIDARRHEPEHNASKYPTAAAASVAEQLDMMHEATSLANTSLLQMQLTSVLQTVKERGIFKLSRRIANNETSKRIGLTTSNLRFARMNLNTHGRIAEGKEETGTTLLGQTERQTLN
jgi:hypothetical protein